MTTIGEALRAEVRRKVGHPHRFVQPQREPTWADVEAEYPTNAGLAAAMGLGGSRDHEPGSAAWRERRSFMDQAARWRRGGERNPLGRGKWAPRLRSVVRSTWRRQSVPHNERQVLALMREHGVTMVHLAATFRYERGRPRDVQTSVALRPEVLRDTALVPWQPTFYEASTGRVNWTQAAQGLLNAWAYVYGMGELPTEEGAINVRLFRFRIGVDPHANWDQGAAA